MASYCNTHFDAPICRDLIRSALHCWSAISNVLLLERQRSELEFRNLLLSAMSSPRGRAFRHWTMLRAVSFYATVSKLNARQLVKRPMVTPFVVLVAVKSIKKLQRQNMLYVARTLVLSAARDASYVRGAQFLAKHGTRRRQGSNTGICDD
jgi:hypothetical protein